MISSNTMSKFLFAQGTKQSSTDDIINLKSKTTQRASSSDFKSVFDSAMNTSSAARSNTSSTTKNQFNNANDSDPVKFKAFREINPTRNVSSTNTQTKPTGRTEEDTKSTETVSVMQKSEIKTYDETIYALAQMLGIQPGDLIQLAEMAGFSTEDLADPTKASMLSEKLSGLMGLDANQQEVLKSALAELSSQLANTENTQVTESNTNRTVGSSELTSSTKSVELSKLAETVKAKLDSLAQTVKSNPEALPTEVSKVIAAMKSQTHVKINDAATQTVVSDGERMSVNVPENVAETTSEQGAIKLDESKSQKDLTAKYSSQNSSSDESKENATSDVQVKVQSADAASQNGQQEQPNVNLFADIKANAVNSPIAADKQTASVPTTVKPSEVLNQVIETAKVIVGQEKSEMVIHLKPDHLGKLELKVVTEQGIVAAKFIAENQQVKEVIETNMQLLKDSLQKQGLSINGVSVQVGQDNRNQYNQPETKNNSSSNKTASVSGNKYGINGAGAASSGVSLLDSIPERLAQYAYDYNTINLTA